MLDGVARAVDRVEVEALFGDGSRLIVLHDPIRATAPPHQGEIGGVARRATAP